MDETIQQEKTQEIEIVGTYKPSPKGFGFVMKDNEKQLLVNFSMLRKTPLFNGDIVRAKATYSEQDMRYHISELELLDTPKRELVGTCVDIDGVLNFMPELSFLAPIPLAANTTVSVGERLKIRAEPGPKNSWFATPLEQLGDLHTKNIESRLSVSEYVIPIVYSQAALDQVAGAVEHGHTHAKSQSNRKDYTSLPFVTIDGEKTLDVDDAIYVEETTSGFKLYVAIADVAEFVKPGSALDTDAYDRGTSIYFIQGTKHMLPRGLSENACSLLPKQKRAALVAEMDITLHGDIQNVTLTQAWIESKHKLSYTQVTEDLASNGLQEWSPYIKSLKAMYDVLLAARIARGSLPIRSGDVHYKLNDSGKIVSIERKSWHLAYGLVEEAMLAANTAVGRWMLDNNLPGIYRHHIGPDLTEWDDKKEFFDALGIDVSTTPSILELANLTESTKDTNHSAAVENIIRSTMKAATYITDKTSHFSLAYDWYTHFTSPIRRYADLSVHRIIKAKLNNEPIPSVDNITKIAEHCTRCDQRARLATRSEEKRLKVQYAQQFVGQTTSGIISGGTKNLIFIKDDALMLEGGSKLPEGWHWNKRLAQLSDDDKHKILVGSSIPATLTGVDIYKWKIEYNTHLDLLVTPEISMDM